MHIVGDEDTLNWKPGSLAGMVRKQKEKIFQDWGWEHIKLNWISDGGLTLKKVYPLGWRHSHRSK